MNHIINGMNIIDNRDAIDNKDTNDTTVNAMLFFMVCSSVFLCIYNRYY